MTFSLIYAFSENFILPFSHDEVVHGKKSMLMKMPGDMWQKFANLRMLYAYYYTHPGKKLMFMGSEFGTYLEFNESKELAWEHLQNENNKKLFNCMKDLNKIYSSEKSLYFNDNNGNGFEWINCNDSLNSVLSYIRKSDDEKDYTVVVLNFTPVVRKNYRVGVNHKIKYKEMFNSDAGIYGGSNVGNAGIVFADDIKFNGRPYSLNLTLPPLCGMIFKPEF